jgi:hypothetical protein
VTEGRVNARTPVQAAGAADWKTAWDFPELGCAPIPGLPGAGPAPPPIPGRAGAEPATGLAITSFVLGLLSLVCFGLLAGVPAVICGHLARARARRLPGQYGGAGFALAGLILGYVSVLVTLVVLPALLLPALSRAKGKAQRVSCTNNLKMIGLSFRTWAIDNEDAFPFNVSTNKGGTLELCRPGRDGFDQNAVAHFQVLANELATPRVLVCPADTSKQAAISFSGLQPANVSYLVCSGTNVSDLNPTQVLAACPVHHSVVLCDGSVQSLTPARWEAMKKAGLSLDAEPK